MNNKELVFENEKIKLKKYVFFIPAIVSPT